MKRNIPDIILGVGLLLPIATIYLLSFVCSGWNEGSMAGTCVIPLLEAPYNILNTFFLVLAFGGVMIYGPILLISWLVSTIQKIRLSKTEHLDTFKAHPFLWLIWAISTAILAYFLTQFFPIW